MTGLPFVVIRGPALVGKTAVARALAERLPGNAAIISQDDLWWRAIARHHSDLASEAELVYRQMKLLSSTYIRARYAVVVDGAFALYRDGAAATHDSDLRDLLGLVSTVPNVRPLLVALTCPLDVLLERARESERYDAPAVEALHRAFEASGLPAALTFDTSEVSADEVADRILDHLGARR
ncbi:MAG: AAA family ATPase [Dehalococcoidia bacterium]